MTMLFCASIVVFVAFCVAVWYAYIEFLQKFKPEDCTPGKFELALHSSMSDRRILRMSKSVEYHNIMTLREVRRYIMEYRPHLFAEIQCLGSKKPIYFKSP